MIGVLTMCLFSYVNATMSVRAHLDACGAGSDLLGIGCIAHTPPDAHAGRLHREVQHRMLEELVSDSRCRASLLHVGSSINPSCASLRDP
ncbi:hypothetical protein C8Q72DRAFT_869157 [Fomitopsis betulina]|nr:hypothetical protein C8Q72DRAFT_869157 [Fomitopsis betulina]